MYLLDVRDALNRLTPEHNQTASSSPTNSTGLKTAQEPSQDVLISAISL